MPEGRLQENKVPFIGITFTQPLVPDEPNPDIEKLVIIIMVKLHIIITTNIDMETNNNTVT